MATVNFRIVMLMLFSTTCFIHKVKGVCALEMDVDYFGGDLLLVENVEDVSQCCTLCRKNSECRVFSYHPSTGKCYMKSAVNPTKIIAGVISSRMDCFARYEQYYGDLSTTVGGYTCKNWNKPYPENHNYCRTKNSLLPWCYTTNNPDRHWDWCFNECPRNGKACNSSSTCLNSNSKCDKISNEPTSIKYCLDMCKCDSECAGNTTCTFGYCVCTPEGEVCKNDKDCCNGNCPSWNDYRCITNDAVKHKCGSDMECDSYLVTKFVTRNGGRCDTNSRCAGASYFR